MFINEVEHFSAKPTGFVDVSSLKTDRAFQEVGKC